MAKGPVIPGQGEFFPEDILEKLQVTRLPSVYYMLKLDFTLMKIGFTGGAVKDRAIKLQLHTMAWYPGTRKDEDKALDYFAPFQVRDRGRREYFYLPESEELETLKQIVLDYGIKPNECPKCELTGLDHYLRFLRNGHKKP